jgi:segregation and condensation protein B
MGLQGKIEAIIYAAEEPVTLEQLATLLRRDVLTELEAQESAPSLPGLELHESDVQDDGNARSGSRRDAEILPEAPTHTATGSEEPSEARQHPDRAPESQEPLSIPESLEQDLGAAEDELTSTTQDHDSSLSRPQSSASISAPAATATKRKKAADPELSRVKAHLRGVMETVMASYATNERGVEVRQIAGGYRMATKPEHHDLVRAFAKSLKPPIKLSLQALETLAIIAYKQPVTAPEIADVRGVDAGGVLGTLLDRKLITTAGRKQVIGRPMQYKTTKEFLLRFGLNDLNELPSMEEFEKLAQEHTDMFSKDVPTETGPVPAEDVDGEGMVDRDGDYSSSADTSESVVRAQVESDDGKQASANREGAPDSEPQRPPEEPREPSDAGDRSDGADTSETIVREQMENEEKR